MSQIKKTLDELESLGARVKVGPPSSAAEIAAAEDALGFELPDDYREFLLELGHIEIELVRTWYFYGLEQGEKAHALYEEELAGARSDLEEEDQDDDDDAPYYPARYLVLADEGDYSNAAEGWVYDGDLEHIRFTAGTDYIERSEFSEDDYKPFLAGQLEEIRARIADPEDSLVGGREAEVNARRKLPG